MFILCILDFAVGTVGSMDVRIYRCGRGRTALRDNTIVRDDDVVCPARRVARTERRRHSRVTASQAFGFVGGIGLGLGGSSGGSGIGGGGCAGICGGGCAGIGGGGGSIGGGGSGAINLIIHRDAKPEV